MKNILFALTLLASLNTWAHGEDKPGPNGGHVRMPGAFHTELNYDEKTQDLHVFLLDMDFKNPSIKDSTLNAVFNSGKTTVTYSCATMDGNHFHCVANKKFKPRGTLTLKATRENAVGNDALYKFPLPAFNEKSPKTDHSGH